MHKYRWWRTTTPTNWQSAQSTALWRTIISGRAWWMCDWTAGFDSNRFNTSALEWCGATSRKERSLLLSDLMKSHIAKVMCFNFIQLAPLLDALNHSRFFLCNNFSISPYTMIHMLGRIFKLSLLLDQLSSVWMIKQWLWNVSEMKTRSVSWF